LFFEATEGHSLSRSAPVKPANKLLSQYGRPTCL
jgi:hypothetical protein